MIEHLGKLFTYNEEDDLQMNFNEFILHLDIGFSVQNIKWIVLSEYFYIQSLLVVAIKGSTPFSVITKQTNIKDKNEEIVKIRLNINQSEPWKFEKDTIFVSYNFYKQDAIRLIDFLSNKGIIISEKQLNNAYEKLFKLLDIENLVKEISKKHSICYTTDAIVLANKEEKEALDNLKSLRNNFIHFVPKGWAIEKYYIISTIYYCLKYSLCILDKRGNHFISGFDHEKAIFEINNRIVIIKKLMM
ncbi:hypothetical protein LLG07_00235 [bacterium]|nr:hypothetical protein [bacterium]